MAIGKVIKSGPEPEPVPEARPAAGVARARGPGVVSSEVYEASEEAKQIIAAATQRAAMIKEQAEQERARVLAEAREQGRQEGLAQTTELRMKAKAHRDDLIAGAEREMVALACRIAEKIIGADLERSPETIINICATAIDNVRNVAALTVRVNPQSAAILREKKKPLMELIGRVKDIAIREDSDVAPGGCIIETDSGTIDAQLSTQLEMIQRVLLADPSGSSEGPA